MGKEVRREASKKRNSSIELLRILSMMGVVLLHYNNEQAGGAFAYVQAGSVNQLWLFWVECLFAGSVNLFMMISGYFLSKNDERKWTKVAEILLQVILFREGIYLAACAVGVRELSAKGVLLKLLPANYFVILYLAVYLLSPYINIVIRELDKQQLKHFLLLVVGLFSIWNIVVDYINAFAGESLEGLSTIGMWGDQYGYTIVNFVLSYLIGAYIRFQSENLQRLRRKYVCYGVLCLLLLYIIALLEEYFLHQHVAWNYNNPLLLGIPACVLILFEGWTFYNKMINAFSRGAFTCFLLHGALIGFVGIEHVVNQNFVVLLGHQIVVVVGLYLISYIVYVIYHICTYWMFMRKEN